jgi:hypothetical protein
MYLPTSILRNYEFTALYDKGYHTGSELKTAQDLLTPVRREKFS